MYKRQVLDEPTAALDSNSEEKMIEMCIRDRVNTAVNNNIYAGRKHGSKYKQSHNIQIIAC